MQSLRNASIHKRLRQGGLLALLVLLVVWTRALLWQAMLQLFFGMLVAMLALPLMRRLEKNLPAGLSASLAMMAVGAMLLGSLVLLAPFIAEQVRQLMGMLPQFYAQMNQWMQHGESWLAQNGIQVNGEIKASLLSKGETWITGVVSATMGQAGNVLDKLSKLLLAPVFAFYFLRDRKYIGNWLLLMLPVGWRNPTTLTLREIRRELAGFLRGQLMISAVVGGLTGLGLLLVGMPNWLLLGVVMGILELIPYLGPFLGGALTLLFALQGGTPRVLWSLLVVVVVQQLEGGMLSPKLMSEATRLHPVLVLLALMMGGLAGGMLGILLAIPLLLCVRAALRVLSLQQVAPNRMENGIFGEKTEQAWDDASKIRK